MFRDVKHANKAAGLVMMAGVVFAAYSAAGGSGIVEETTLTITTFGLHRESMSGSGDDVLRVGRHDSVERAGGKA